MATCNPTADFSSDQPVPPPPPSPTSWSTLIQIEPRLREAEHSAHRGTCERDWIRTKWYFERLVGWDASRSELRNEAAFHVVYDRMRDIHELAVERYEAEEERREGGAR